jgi:hypothetical protein
VSSAVEVASGDSAFWGATILEVLDLEAVNLEAVNLEAMSHLLQDNHTQAH